MSNLQPEIYLVTDTELEGGKGLGGMGEYTSILSLAFCTSNVFLVCIISCIIYSKAHCKTR